MSDNSILVNSIWPNGIKVDSDGHAIFYPLGTNKIEVPSESEWPKGDKLVSPFVYEDELLVGFVDTKAMTVSGSTTITLPYSHIEADFSSIVLGDLIINAPNATVKEFTWAVVSGDGEEGGTVITFKYKGCSTVDEVKAVDANYLNTDIVNGVWSEGLGDLENSDWMFSHATCSENALSSFTSDLSKLNHGYYMFFGCTALTSFDAELPSLSYGEGMFAGCSALTDFNCDDLSSLTNGDGMFDYCHNLTSFSSDLSSLLDGEDMFNWCTNLTTFNSDLSSLTEGKKMFYYCKLSTDSVLNIAETINDVRDYSFNIITISIDNSTPNEQEEAAFNAIADKGWVVDVYVNQNRHHTCYMAATTLDETGEVTQAPIPFYAKPIPSDEEHAEYVDAEGNFYYILGGNYIYGDDISTYGMFTCEEEAAANMRLTKIGAEKIETA